MNFLANPIYNLKRFKVKSQINIKETSLSYEHEREQGENAQVVGWTCALITSLSGELAWARNEEKNRVILA